MKTFTIYYHDLNEKAKKELLEFVGETDPREMNWTDNEYMDIFPLAFYDVEEDGDDRT